MRRKQESSLSKALLLLALLSLVMLSTSTVLSAFPQHLMVTNKTIIDNDIKFGNGNTVTVQGNQVQFSEGDLITAKNQGRSYIKITGRQTQFGDFKAYPGIRTLTASMTQIALFQQRIGSFSINKAAQIVIDGYTIQIVPISADSLNIRTVDSNYIVQFSGDTTYINQNGIMLRLSRSNNEITAYLVGLESHSQIIMRVI